MLIPAAMENQITDNNAGKVQAGLVVEAANGPTTPMTDKALSKRGIPAIPDILVNSGGVIVSYYEWVQNLEREHWEIDEVNRKLENMLVKAFRNVYDYAEKSSLSYRMSALTIAVEKVASTMQLTGFR